MSDYKLCGHAASAALPLRRGTIEIVVKGNMSLNPMRTKIRGETLHSQLKGRNKKIKKKLKLFLRFMVLSVLIKGLAVLV